MSDRTNRETETNPDDELEMLRSRVAALEARLDARSGIDCRKIDVGVARAVQSIGVVVDYLAMRGLIDMRGLQQHIAGNFLIDRMPDGDDEGRSMLDIYGWIMWSEASRYLRPSRQPHPETT